MFDDVRGELQAELDKIRAAGLWKDERVLASPQGPEIRLADGREVLVFCANNYLGLSSHPQVIAAAHRALDERGYGLSSVRFICGTQDIHKALEQKIAEFLKTEDTILYAACFDANGGIFEPLLGEEDAIISDALNHASIIDGVRLCKAQRWRYESNDMRDLERCLKEAEAKGCRRKLIATDGAFSMDGAVADLRAICDLADRYRAMVMVDDCHGTGFLGATGRGSTEHSGVMGRVDIITGTLGKALGGALGGFTTGRREIIALLRQRSRPYLFSNTLPPSVVGASIAVFDLLSATTALRDKLMENTKRFRSAMTAAGFDIKPGEHPIVPIMLYDERLAHDMARKLLDQGIYVIGFSFPVVPKGRSAHPRSAVGRARPAISTEQSRRSPRSGGRWACSRRRRAAPDRIEPGSARRADRQHRQEDVMARKKSSTRKAAPKRRAVRPKPRSGAARKRATATPAPQSARLGLITHTELVSLDPAATQAWCAKVLGWKFAPPMPTPTGPYRMWRFANNTGGGIRANNPSEMPGSIPFCEVKSIRTAFDQALSAGAREMLAPQEIPGGMGWIAIVAAPGGPPIGFWAPK